MKVTYQAVAHTNAVLNQIEQATEAFSAYPELFNPSFWDHMMSCASNPKYAQTILEELDEHASNGVTMSQFVARNLVEVMQVARTTLRTKELSKHR